MSSFNLLHDVCFFWKCWAAILGSINREAEESGYRGSMWYSVKRYWQGMFTCQASLEWIYSVYMWIFIFYQARFWTSRCIRVCLLEEGFFLSESVRSLLLIRSSACESFNFLRILKSPFPKLPNNTIGHRTMESLRIRECIRDVKVHPLQTPARAMQQLVPSQQDIVSSCFHKPYSFRYTGVHFLVAILNWYWNFKKYTSVRDPHPDPTWLDDLVGRFGWSLDELIDPMYNVSCAVVVLNRTGIIYLDIDIIDIHAYL